MGWFCHQSYKTCLIKHIWPECLPQGFQSGCDRQPQSFGLAVESKSQKNAMISEQRGGNTCTFIVNPFSTGKGCHSAETVFEEQHHNSELKYVT